MLSVSNVEGHGTDSPGLLGALQVGCGELPVEHGDHLLDLVADTDFALAFLDALDRDGRHDLASINPDLPDKHPDKIQCASFLFPEQRERARAWIDARQGKVNIYYSVNRAKKDAPRNKRLDHEKRKDIGYIRASVHDFDLKLKPGATSEDIAIERRRLRDLAEEIAVSACPPTIITDTGGGGFHTIWQHANPTLATPENIATAEGFGRAIKNRFGGDLVSDMPRIMRLVGTINVLSPAKKKTGRVPALVQWLPDLSSGARYTLEELAAWMPPVPRTAADGGGNQDWQKVPIDMDAVAETQIDGELPAALKRRFDSFRQEEKIVGDLWNGVQSAGRDGSPSGLELALTGQMKGEGYTPTEITQVISIYPHRSEKHADDLQRRVARCWINSKVEAGSRKRSAHGFTPYTLGESRQWDPPGDLWAIDDKPPALPARVLPDIVECVSNDRAQRLGVAAGAPAAALITVLGSLVSAGNRLQMRQRDPDWTVKPILWTAIIGLPGSNKSATINAATSVVHAIEGKWRREYAAAESRYQELERRRQPRKTKAETAAVDPVAAHTDQIFTDSETFEALASKKPRFRQKLFNDATTEALAVSLSENPAGVLHHADELAGWLGSMDAYRAKGGKDRPFWLQAKEGGPLAINRKQSARVCVDNLAVSILGGIQPDKIKALGLGMVDDGLLQRFTPVLIERTGNGQDIDPIPGLAQRLERTAFAIVDSEQNGNYRFSPEANAELEAIESFKAREIARADTSPHLQQWLEKTPNEFGRVALVFHFIEWHGSAEGETIGGAPPQLVSQATARRARRYVTEFAYRHARVFYQRDLGRTEIEDHAAWVAGFILARGSEAIDARDIYRAHRPLRGDRKDLIPPVMRILEMWGWVRPVNAVSSLATDWRVNPLVHDGRFAERAAVEKARRKAAQESIAKDAEDRRAVG